MAKGTFGERLKRERELREVPLSEIANATRISPKFLEALENEQWEKLPGGVFGHGFVRTIARYLGLSEEDLLSEYDMARAESSAQTPQKPEQRIPSPPKWIPVAGVLLLILLLAGIFFAGRYAWHAFLKHRAAKPTANLVLPIQDSSPVVTPPGPLELSVASSAATRVRVLADGTVAYDAVLSVGQSLHFSARDSFQVTAGNSSAVLLELNGRELPPLGMPGNSGTISLSARDLRPTNRGVIQP
jgi:cytoskeleton protein RodZ